MITFRVDRVRLCVKTYLAQFLIFSFILLPNRAGYFLCILLLKLRESVFEMLVFSQIIGILDLRHGAVTIEAGEDLACVPFVLVVEGLACWAQFVPELVLAAFALDWGQLVRFLTLDRQDGLTVVAIHESSDRTTLALVFLPISEILMSLGPCLKPFTLSTRQHNKVTRALETHNIVKIGLKVHNVTQKHIYFSTYRTGAFC